MLTWKSAQINCARGGGPVGNSGKWRAVRASASRPERMGTARSRCSSACAWRSPGTAAKEGTPGRCDCGRAWMARTPLAMGTVNGGAASIDSPTRTAWARPRTPNERVPTGPAMSEASTGIQRSCTRRGMPKFKRDGTETGSLRRGRKKEKLLRLLRLVRSISDWGAAPPGNAAKRVGADAVAPKAMCFSRSRGWPPALVTAPKGASARGEETAN
jgi:hypothetical protein